MAATISVYNQTVALITGGVIKPGVNQTLMLCTAATFDPTNTNLSGVTYTEVASGNGYTTGGQQLTGVTSSIVTTNDAIYDANDVSWSATGSGITASYGLLYLSGNSNQMIAFIDFGGSQTANAGSLFKVVWSANGIFSFTVS